MDAREVVDAFGEAWLAHDLDATLALLTDDCLFEAAGPAPDGVEHRGRDAIRAAWADIFADAASRFEVEETVAAGKRVMQRWTYHWADGHVRGVDLFAVEGGLISEKRSYVKG